MPARPKRSRCFFTGTKNNLGSPLNAKSLLLLCFVFTFFCMASTAQQDSFPLLHGNYLGMKTPAQQPEIFAKGIVSTEGYEHSAPAFSPDGNLLLWGNVERDKPSVLLEMKRVGDTWSKPASPSFTSGKYDDMYPFFSADGKKLFFGSRRPLPAGSPAGDIRIWAVDRTATGWGEPYPFDTTVSQGFEYAHSFSKAGNLYFSARKVQNGKPGWSIYCSMLKKGQYQPPQLLDSTINNGSYVDGPLIAPDESFLIFESDRQGGLGSIDLFICFKQSNGKWGRPVNMGPAVNSAQSERFAGLSPDGKYFFFGSNRASTLPDVYWMDADIINELKKASQ